MKTDEHKAYQDTSIPGGAAGDFGLTLALHTPMCIKQQIHVDCGVYKDVCTYIVVLYTYIVTSWHLE